MFGNIYRSPFLYNERPVSFYFSQVQITEDVRQYLRKPTFDNWQWDEPEMLVLLQQMYIDLGFVTKFKIEVGE